MKKLTSIFKHFYLLMLILIILFCFATGKFLKKYIYDTLTNSQIISIFKGHISLPNAAALENIEKKIEEKMAVNEIKWEKINNPFGNTAYTDEGKAAGKKIEVVN